MDFGTHTNRMAPLPSTGLKKEKTKGLPLKFYKLATTSVGKGNKPPPNKMYNQFPNKIYIWVFMEQQTPQQKTQNSDEPAYRCQVAGGIAFF